MMRWRLYDTEFYDEIPELGTGHVWEEEEEETLTCTCYGRGKTMEDVYMPRVPHLHVLIEKQKAMDTELGPPNTRRHGRGRARLVKQSMDPSSGDVMAVGQLQIFPEEIFCNKNLIQNGYNKIDPASMGNFPNPTPRNQVQTGGFGRPNQEYYDNHPFMYRADEFSSEYKQPPRKGFSLENFLNASPSKSKKKKKKSKNLNSVGSSCPTSTDETSTDYDVITDSNSDLRSVSPVANMTPTSQVDDSALTVQQTENTKCLELHETYKRFPGEDRNLLSKQKAKIEKTKFLLERKLSEEDNNGSMWHLCGENVVEISGLSNTCDMSLLQDLVAAYGVIKDFDVLNIDEAVSVRYQLGSSEAVDWVVSNLHGADYLFPDSADEALKRIAKIKHIETNERKSYKRPKIPQENPVCEDRDTDPKSEPLEPVKESVSSEDSKDEKTKPVKIQFEKPPRFIKKEQSKVKNESETESSSLTDNSPPYSSEPSMFFQKKVNEIQQPEATSSQSSALNTAPQGIPYQSHVHPYFFNPLVMFPNFHGFPLPNNQHLCPQVPIPNIDVPSHSTPLGNPHLFSTNTEANKLHDVPSESTQASIGVPKSFHEYPYTEQGHVQFSEVNNQFVEIEQKDNETTLSTPKVPPTSVPPPPFTMMPPFPYLQPSSNIPHLPYYTIPQSPYPQTPSQVPHSQLKTVPQTPCPQSSASVPRPPYDTRTPSPYLRPPYLFIPPSYHSPAQRYPAVYIPYPYTPSQAFVYPPQTTLQTPQQMQSSAKQLHGQTLLLKSKDQ